LFYLDDGRDRAQTMSDKLGLSRQAVSLTVRELEKAGIIALQPDPAKKNARLIKMTPKGRQSVEHAFDVLRRLESRIARRVGAGRLADLKKVLQADWG
ncbi:MAG: MarR family transcriptional regulator, partial [Pseudomonadota bacterium]